MPPTIQSPDPFNPTRRTFLLSTGAGAAAALVVGFAPAAADAVAPSALPLRLELTPTGGCTTFDGPELVPAARWYEAGAAGDGLECRFAAGTLAGARFLTADLLVDGSDLAIFQLRLREGENGPAFTLDYAALPEAEARLRMRTEAVNQNRWQFPREGAWLKPMAGGAVVDLARVDRLTIQVLRKSERPVRWCQTPVTVTAGDVATLERPRLPRGKLLDEFGQSRLREWPGKTRNEAELTTRLRAQLQDAPSRRWPVAFSTWGGLAARTETAKQFFRTHHDGRRWWLLDPDGHPFWSAGLDSVNVDTAAAYQGLEPALAFQPPADGPYREIYGQRAERPATINYLAANFIRAFGPTWRERWNTITIAGLKHLGFNTIANWSDWKVAQAARFPYVRPLEFDRREAPFVFRDLPDVFDSRFQADASRFAAQLLETREDPAFIGYFLMNEPTWGFARQTPAAGMLLNTPHCASRAALRDHLARKYGDDLRLSSAWATQTTLDAVAEGTWTAGFSTAAEADFAEFSGVMIERYFKTLSDACRKIDPNHLNLGIRYYTIPPPWAVAGMKTFDVFSMNCYESKVRASEMASISDLLGMPVLVGEWHFGALDVGLPASGIGHVRTQQDRGRAYRAYLEDAAARPWCVGVHYFILYDQSALGRFDGECYNIGFFDVCNRPYEPLCEAARASHERLYDVAIGKQAPFDDAPEYLPKLFL